MLEVDGFAAASPPPVPCDFSVSDNCTNANGTFILSRYAGGTSLIMMPDGLVGSRTQCFWQSPSFLMRIPQPTVVPGPSGNVTCYTCDQGRAMLGYIVQPRYYRLELTIDYRVAIDGTFTTLATYAYLFIGDSFFNGAVDNTQYNIAVWESDKTGVSATFDCLGTNVMSLVRDDFYDPQSGNLASAPFCCDGIPQSLTLLPLE
jgi:hypothetical protein